MKICQFKEILKIYIINIWEQLHFLIKYQNNVRKIHWVSKTQTTASYFKTGHHIKRLTTLFNVGSWKRRYSRNSIFINFKVNGFFVPFPPEILDGKVALFNITLFYFIIATSRKSVKRLYKKGTQMFYTFSALLLKTTYILTIILEDR